MDTFDEALATLGELLASRGLRYEVFAVGGGALLLLGLITRPTKDIDVVGVVVDGTLVMSRVLPPPLEDAVRDVAVVLGLRADWLNAGPAALAELGLPPGALARATVREWSGLRLLLASRRDQIFFKLYAAVDQGPDSRHFFDLRALEPTAEELLAAGRWARTHDPSAAFHTELEAALRAFGIDHADV